MFKKKLLTFAALAFCAAIVTAQTKGTGTPRSSVNEATAYLIEDGAIDSLPFGNEDGKGILFGQYKAIPNTVNKVEFGWGNAFGDALWLSLYDGIEFHGLATGKTNKLTKAYGVADGVNVDYVDDREKEVDGSNNIMYVNNDLAVGVGINDTFGIQAVWAANWQNYNDSAISFTENANATGLTGFDYWKLNVTTNTANDTITLTSSSDLSTDTADSKDGKTTSTKYDKIKKYSRSNTITLNFKGAGVEDLGDIAFYAKLNKIYSGLNFTNYSNDYSKTTAYLGKTQETKTASGVYESTTIDPGLAIEFGFNLPAMGVMQPKLAFMDDFDIKFNILKEKTTSSVETEKVATRDTVTTEYEKKAGKTLYWNNTFTPVLIMDFDLVEKLTLKTALSAGVSITQNNKGPATYKAVRTSTVYNRASGNLTTNTVDTVEWGDNQSTNTFTTSVTPMINLGLVYAVIPETTSINFGVQVAPGAYTWTTTETKNSNINTVKTTETTNAYGTKSTTKTVTVNNNGTDNGANKGFTESKGTTFSNGTTTATFNIGATWRFTENAKLDVFYRNDFTKLFDNSNTFGVDFSVMF